MTTELSKPPLRGSRMLHETWDLIKFALICFAIVFPIRMFVAQPFVVNGDSMNPTFHNGDYIIVDQLIYKFSAPKRGDVVIFRLPDNTKRFLIKRVIGLPGETVKLGTTDITIINTEHPDGFVLTAEDEPYISHSFAYDKTTVLDDDEYLVLGDNRPNSSDSHIWGTLPEKDIVGRAWLRLLPFNALNAKPGDYRGSYAVETALFPTDETTY